MTKQEMKQKVIQAIDESRNELLKIRDQIYCNPEYGYKEFQTTELVASYLEQQLELDVERNIAITGCLTKLQGKKEGPCVAILGELDAISCKDHKDANEIGASHTCGHNLQVTGMLGAITGLVKSGVMKELAGSVHGIATPAEEFIELEYREKLKKEGKLTYFGGKQELIKKGYFDDVDMAMMFHSLNMDKEKAIVASTSNGFIGKKIKFIGKEAHAGAEPYLGINALDAAMLGINNVNALRSTFREGDKIRFHPIITKGGDIVNVVPADVQMEAYVRASSMEALGRENDRINQALKAGGMAVGAEVEITEIPGYFPLVSNEDLCDIMIDNLQELGLKDEEIVRKREFSGSLDFGDLSHIMPAIHPMIGGIEGALHTKNYKIIDDELSSLVPAKMMAMAVIDLLYDEAQGAKKVLENYEPVMTKEEYLEFLKRNDRTI